jgi:hypothetical protein
VAGGVEGFWVVGFGAGFVLVEAACGGAAGLPVMIEVGVASGCVPAESALGGALLAGSALAGSIAVADAGPDGGADSVLAAAAWTALVGCGFGGSDTAPSTRVPAQHRVTIPAQAPPRISAAFPAGPGRGPRGAPGTVGTRNVGRCQAVAGGVLR